MTMRWWRVTPFIIAWRLVREEVPGARFGGGLGLGLTWTLTLKQGYRTSAWDGSPLTNVKFRYLDRTR